MVQVSKVPDIQVSLRKLALQLVAVTLLVNLFLSGIAAWSLWESRGHYRERATAFTQNLTLILEKYIAGSVEKIDLTLMALADETERQLAAGGIDEKRLNQQIARQEARLPELDALRVANARGDVVFGTGLVAGKLANVAGRDYFMRLRDDPRAGLVISKPVVGLISKQWVLILARRLNLPDGSFAGVIYGVIPLDHFRNIFSHLEVGRAGIVSLCDRQLRIIARVPGPRSPENYVGKLLTSSDLHRMVRAGNGTGTFTAVSSLDGIDRIYTFRALDGYPFYIFVGRGIAEYLEPWRTEARDLVAVAGCFALLSCIASYQIFKRRKRDRLAEAELRRKEQLLIQQSRLAAMGEMLGNIAHQWRQPLNLLGLIVQDLRYSYKKGLLTEELLTGQIAKTMEVIGHMSRTIDDFRNLLSPDRVKVTFSINEAVGTVLSMLQLKAKVELLAEEECFAEGGRNEFSQVIINIVANANDVFRERQIPEPKLTVRIFRKGERTVVTIADNGGGIAPGIMEKVFDPYFTTKGPDRGTGVGLFMSKTIVEKSMKGSLTVRNVADGAEFRIEV